MDGRASLYTCIEPRRCTWLFSHSLSLLFGMDSMFQQERPCVLTGEVSSWRHFSRSFLADDRGLVYPYPPHPMLGLQEHNECQQQGKDIEKSYEDKETKKSKAGPRGAVNQETFICVT